MNIIYKLYQTIEGIILMIACLSLFSCTNEIGEKEVDGEIEGAKTYLSVRMLTDDEQILSRAETAGTPNEQKVESIYLLFFSSADDRLRYCFDLKATTDGSSAFAGEDVLAGSATSSFSVKARLVKSNNYKLLVIANPKGTLGSQLKDAATTYPEGITDKVYTSGTGNASMSLDTYLSEASKAKPEDFFDGDAGETGNPPQSFTMTNANGIIRIADTRLKPSAEEAEDDPVVVSLDRVVAKVMVRKSNQFAITGGTLAAGRSLIWAPVVTNNYTYLTRKQTDLLDSKGPEPEADGTGAGLPDRKYIYAEDPNFDGEYGTSGNYQYAGTEPDTAGMPGCNPAGADGDAGSDQVRYVLENTLSLDRQAADQWEDYTTEVLIYAYIVPEGLTAADYYSFKPSGTDAASKVFTHEQAVEWERIQSFPDDMAGLKEAIEADRAGSHTFDFTQDTPPAAFCTSQGITFHKGGLNKYRIPLKHFIKDGVADPQTSVRGYLGVVRNNKYIVTITGITGPGDGSSDARYISGNIMVNPWWVIPTQEESLTYEEF